MRVKSKLTGKITLLLLFPIVIWAFAASGKGGEKIKVIDPSHTCMGSNMAQEKAQNFVEVDGRKYYGCSSMCIVNLKENPNFRYSLDPVSGKRVDKALAIVAARSGGDLLYFESDKTLKSYRE